MKAKRGVASVFLLGMVGYGWTWSWIPWKPLRQVVVASRPGVVFPLTSVPTSCPESQPLAAESKFEYYLDEVDICLSKSDSILSGRSKSKDLNTLSNLAIKAILLTPSVQALQDVKDARDRFLKDWEEGEDFTMTKKYIDALVYLAENKRQSDVVGDLDSKYIIPYRRILSVLHSAKCKVEKEIELQDIDICLSVMDNFKSSTYTKSLTRELNEIANNVGRTLCFGSNENIEGYGKELRNHREGLQEKWSLTEDASELMFYDALVSLLENGLDNTRTILSQDTTSPYLNAYQRLVAYLVEEIGTRSAPTTEKVVESFVRWETELRKNITEPRWDSYPEELVGSWMLIDDDIQTRGAQIAVIFNQDGKIVVPDDLGTGISWILNPGPTHLDTCTFRVLRRDDIVVEYTGYIDRGQRIETRLSGRPVQMTGRATTVIKGDRRLTSKFTMELIRPVSWKK